MWVNAGDRPPANRAKSTDAPHQRDRCEACRLGRCLADNIDDHNYVDYINTSTDVDGSDYAEYVDDGDYFN